MIMIGRKQIEMRWNAHFAQPSKNSWRSPIIVALSPSHRSDLSKYSLLFSRSSWECFPSFPCSSLTISSKIFLMSLPSSHLYSYFFKHLADPRYLETLVKSSLNSRFLSEDRSGRDFNISRKK